MVCKSDVLAVRHNYNQYHVPGCPRTHRVKKNVVCINRHSTLKHELFKFLGCWMLSKYGDVKVDDVLRCKVVEISECVDSLFKFWEVVSTDFITEAVPCSEPERRVDLVDLRSGVRFEFETDKRVKKDNCVTIYI